MTALDHLELLLALVTAVVVLSAVAQRVRLPPAAAFVLGGMALATIPHVPAMQMDPDMVLVLFLPPLLQAGAFGTVWRDFRADIVPILVLALGAVVFTTAIVGWVAHLVMPSLSWAACFTLGAIVSPPDAVAAKAVLQRLHLPRRLVTILEGESLINDASGLVLYRFAVAAAMSGQFSAPAAAGSFVWLAAGGVAVGLAFGTATDWLMRRIHDPFQAIIISFLVGYASYIGAERVHVSGVLAVVACGLVVGMRQHETLTAEVRTQAVVVWEVVVFLLEALVFVLIGLSLRDVLDRTGMLGLEAGLGLAAAVTAAVVLARFVVVFPYVYSRQLFGRRGPPLGGPLVVSWAGMRGVVSLAAALALPESMGGRDAILFATFGVILATVLLQGTTLGPLVRLLRLGDDRASATMLSEHAARAQVLAATADYLEARPGGKEQHPRLLQTYKGRAAVAARYLEDMEALDVHRQAHFEMALELVAQSRRALLDLHRGERIHDTVLHAIEAELDLEELHLRKLGGVGTPRH